MAESYLDRFSSRSKAREELSKLKKSAKDAMVKYEVETTVEVLATVAAYGYLEQIAGSTHYTADGKADGASKLSLFAKTNDDGSLKLDDQGKPQGEGVPASLILGGVAKAVQFFGGDLITGYEGHIGNVGDALLSVYVLDQARAMGKTAHDKGVNPFSPDKGFDFNNKAVVKGEGGYSPFGFVSGGSSPATPEERAAYQQAIGR